MKGFSQLLNPVKQLTTFKSILVCLFMFCLVNLQYAQSYCSTFYNNGTSAGDYISLVEIVGTSLSSTSTGAANPYYTLFPNSGTTTGTLTIGTPYQVNVAGGTYSYCYIGAWGDWNQNGIFESSEYIGISPNVGNTVTGAFTNSLTIPYGALSGVTRLRFRSSDTNPGPTSPQSCGSTNSGYGEAEDYEIYVAPLPGCSGSPLAGITISSTTLTCSNNSFDLSLSGNSYNSAITYQWQSSLNGTVWTNLGTLSASWPYTVSGQTITTLYRCITTCTASALTATSTPITVNQIAVANCYCQPSYLDCDYNYFFSNINFASLTSYTASCSPGSNSYQDLTGSVSTISVTGGQTYSLSVDISQSGKARLGAWIDYNYNGVFDNSEYSLIASNVYGGTYTANITVPINVQSNVVRMRLKLEDGIITQDPCSSVSANGQTLDFLVNITALAPCTGAPVAGNAITTSTSVCANTTYTVDLTGITQASGMSFQWQYSANGTAWSNIGSSQTTTSYSISTQTSTSHYRCIITCTSSALSATSTPVVVNQNAFNLCYCNPGNVSCSSSSFTDVSFAGINNTGLVCGTIGYDDFTATSTATVTGGLTYTLSAVFNSQAGTGYAGVWIDFDHNGLFDAYEYTDLGSSGNITQTITVPYTALGGATTMRLKLESSFSNAVVLDPCSNQQFSGHTIDYGVFIIPSTPCSGTPNAGIAVASVTNACPNSPFTLNLSGNALVSGASYQWQYSLNGTAWLNLGLVQSIVPYTITNQTVTTYYRCLVTCLSNTLSQTSASIAIGQNPVSACYCIPPATDCTNSDEINNVVFGVISNTTACSQPSGYNDFTSTVATATIAAGQSYTMAVTLGKDYSENVSVWIDYDHSGSFDASEYTFLGSLSGSGNYTVTNSINIPATALTGTTRMRIRNFNGTALSDFQACASPTSLPGKSSMLLPGASYGETEDYLVDILLPNCGGNNLPPGLSVSSSSTTICLNDAIILDITGAIPSYSGLTYQWQAAVSTGSVYVNIGSPSTSTSLTTSPTQNTTYICTILCNGNVGSSTSSVSVTVNSTTINATASSYTVCPAESVTLTATGATTYTWTNNGAATASTAFTPTIGTTYTVNGTGSNGCVGTNTTFIYVKTATGISGSITTGGSIPVAGTAILYKYEPFFTKFDSVTSQAITGGGTYNFTSVNYGIYIVKAVPQTSTLQVTYGLSSVNWKTAATISHSCTVADVHNINVIPLTSIGTGPGALSGMITEGVGFGQKPSSIYSPLAPGQPIKGIIVKGGKNPGGNMFAQTVTSTGGTYTLSGLPNNAAGEEYFILVDIPGLDTNNTYHRIITSVNNVFTNLDFVVDSAKINPVQSVGINSLMAAENKVKLFPNPASNKVTLQYTLPLNSNVKIELYDLVGKCVKTILPETEQSNQEHSYSIALDDLSSGMYFVKLKINTSETVIKLFISN